MSDPPATLHGCHTPLRCYAQRLTPLGGPTARETYLDHRRYHMVVARREVLVQLDDELVDQLDQLAKRMHTSRSELLRRGARVVLQADDLAHADAQLVAAYQRQPPDQALVRSALQLANETAPAW